MNDVAELPELVTIDPAAYTAAVYQPFRLSLATIKAEAAGVSYDIATTAGMRTAITWRAKLRDIRVGAEKARKEKKAPILEIGKLLDQRYKEIEAEIQPLEDRFDADIKQAEAKKEAEKAAKAEAERLRQEALQAKVLAIGQTAHALITATPEEIEAASVALKVWPITAEEFGEYAGRALMAQTETLEELNALHAKAVAREAEAARIKAEREELERLRREAAERDRAEAQRRAEEDKQRALAEAAAAAKAKAEREAHEAEMQRQRAEQEAQAKAQAAEIAKQRAEIERQQAEIRAQQDAVRREAEAKAKAERDAAEAKRRAEQEAAELAADLEAKRKRAANRPSDDELATVIAEHYAIDHADAWAWLATFSQ